MPDPGRMSFMGFWGWQAGDPVPDAKHHQAVSKQLEGCRARMEHLFKQFTEFMPLMAMR